MADINSDFAQRVVVHSAQIPWIASPIVGVDRRRLVEQQDTGHAFGRARVALVVARECIRNDLVGDLVAEHHGDPASLDDIGAASLASRPLGVQWDSFLQQDLSGDGIRVELGIPQRRITEIKQIGWI